MTGADSRSARRAMLRSIRRRSDRRAQGDRPTLRSITPKRASRSFDASVDHSDARCAKARLAPSVRLATPVQTEDKPAASDEL